MEVVVIYAVNTQDFEEGSILVAGKTKEAAEKAFVKVCSSNWMDYEKENPEDDFYLDYEMYEHAWRKEYWTVPVAE